jgi:hypothetical protein
MFINLYKHDISVFALNCNKNSLTINLHVKSIASFVLPSFRRPTYKDFVFEGGFLFNTRPLCSVFVQMNVYA